MSLMSIQSRKRKHEETKEKKKRWFVYVVQSMQTGRTYVGMTVNNPVKRLRQHNGIIKGGANLTKRGQPFRTVMYITASRKWFTKIEALQLEWCLKHYTRRLYGKFRKFKKIPLNKKRAIPLFKKRDKRNPWIQRVNALVWIFDKKDPWTSNSPEKKDIKAPIKLRWRIHREFFETIDKEKQICDWAKSSCYWPASLKPIKSSTQEELDNVIQEYYDLQKKDK
jgi:predicted GIY-YIG superfamily endonuclease